MTAPIPIVNDTKKELPSPVSVELRMFFKTDLVMGIHYISLPQSSVNFGYEIMRSFQIS